MSKKGPSTMRPSSTLKASLIPITVGRGEHVDALFDFRKAARERRSRNV
jgi:hypothetical protein